MGELAGIFVGLGGGALMATGNPQLAIGLIAAGLAIAIARRPFPRWAKTALMAAIVAGWVWAAWAVRDVQPRVRAAVRLWDATFADGSVVDGIPWEPRYRRYSISLTTDHAAPIVDFKATILMPDLIVQARESQSSGLSCTHMMVTRASASFSLEGGPPQVLSEAALTNELTLTAARVTPGSGISLSVITQTGSGQEEGLLIVSTVHDYWGDDVIDPDVGYRIVVDDEDARAFSVDSSNPLTPPFKRGRLMGGIRRFPPGASGTKAQLRLTIP